MKAIQKVHAFNSQLNFPLKKESTKQLPKKYVGGQSVYNPINHESFHEGRVGNRVCSNGQAKEREKGRDFWLSEVNNKKRNTKRLTSNRTEGGIAKNVHANIKFWTVYSTLIRDCALWQHFKLAAVHPESNLFHLQKVSVRFQLSNVSP